MIHVFSFGLLFPSFFSFCDENDIPVFIYLYPLSCASTCRAGILSWYSFIVCLSAPMNMIKHEVMPCTHTVVTRLSESTGKSVGFSIRAVYRVNANSYGLRSEGHVTSQLPRFHLGTSNQRPLASTAQLLHLYLIISYPYIPLYTVILIIQEALCNLNYLGSIQLHCPSDLWSETTRSDTTHETRTKNGRRGREKCHQQPKNSPSSLIP